MYWRAPVCTTNGPDSTGQSIAVRYKTRRKSAAAASGKCHIFAARVPYQRLRRSAAEPERVQSAQDVRLEPVQARVAKFGGRPPPDLGEFARVRTQGLPHATGEGEPQADVHMPRRGRTYGLGHRKEEVRSSACSATAHSAARREVSPPAERGGWDGQPQAAGRRSIAKTKGPSAEITVKPRCW